MEVTTLFLMVVGAAAFCALCAVVTLATLCMYIDSTTARLRKI